MPFDETEFITRQICRPQPVRATNNFRFVEGALSQVNQCAFACSGIFSGPQSGKRNCRAENALNRDRHSIFESDGNFCGAENFARNMGDSGSRSGAVRAHFRKPERTHPGLSSQLRRTWRAQRVEGGRTTHDPRSRAIHLPRKERARKGRTIALSAYRLSNQRAHLRDFDEFSLWRKPGEIDFAVRSSNSVDAVAEFFRRRCRAAKFRAEPHDSLRREFAADHKCRCARCARTASRADRDSMRAVIGFF